MHPLYIQVRKNVLSSLTSSEKEKLAHYHEMFEGVYKTVSGN